MAFAPVFQRPFSATFDRHAAAAGNGLLNNLIACWKLDETSGDALDAHTNALTLTDFNTVTNATGKVYGTARKYTSANNEYHARNGDDDLLSAGDTDFTIATWVLLDSKANQIIASKWNYLTNNREYTVRYLSATDRFDILISKDGLSGASIATLTANSSGPLSTATWYLVMAQHDAVANTLSIQVNDGPVDSIAWSNGVFNGSARFALGTLFGPESYFNGRIGPVAFWKSAAGAGGVLSAAQRTALYNGGAGLAYSAFTA